MTPSGIDHVTGLVCDLDGTLIDSAAELAEVYGLVFAEAGLPGRDEAWVRPWIGRTPPEIFVANGAAPEVAADLTARLREILADTAGTNAVVYADTEPLLERAAELGIPVAVATNRPTWLAERVLHRTGLLKWFTRVVGTGTHEPKPAPAMLFEAAGGGDPVGWWMVGDTSDDMVAGRGAGMRTLAVLRDDLHREAIEAVGPDRCEPDLRGLTQRIGLLT